MVRRSAGWYPEFSRQFFRISIPRISWAPNKRAKVSLPRAPSLVSFTIDPKLHYALESLGYETITNFGYEFILKGIYDQDLNNFISWQRMNIVQPHPLVIQIHAAHVDALEVLGIEASRRILLKHFLEHPDFNLNARHSWSELFRRYDLFFSACCIAIKNHKKMMRWNGDVCICTWKDNLNIHLRIFFAHSISERIDRRKKK